MGAAARDSKEARTCRYPTGPLQWLVEDWQWPYAGAFAACFLLVLAPIVWTELGLAAMLVYLQLPAYMLHQLEEHGSDRFRRYVNERLAGGWEALTPSATFAINLVGVWVVMATAFLLAVYVEPALGLIAVYLTAVNALVHLLAAAATRSYNPGLVTAVAIFVPLALWAALEVRAAYDPTAATRLTALAVALLGHAAIVVAIAPRLRRDASGTR